MTSNDFRRWLEEAICDFNTNHLRNEQKRIQSIIDERLGKVHLISMKESGLASLPNSEEEASSIESKEGRRFGQNLSKTVAREKADNINELRPAIKKLGERIVSQLILDIFLDIEKESYKITQMAIKYGISKATLSRFAGSKWFEKIEDNRPVTVPDLWKNTAQILSRNPDFMETATTSGVADNVKEVLRLIDPNPGQKNDP